MGFLAQDHGDAFDRPSKEDSGMFFDIWPSETFGSGYVEANNKRTGQGQGKGSFLRKAPCQLCGYPNDLNKIDHSGGSEDGDGAGGPVSKTTATASLPNGTVLNHDGSGNQSPRRGAGCALCFSKNSSKEKFDIMENMNPIPPLGF